MLKRDPDRDTSLSSTYYVLLLHSITSKRGAHTQEQLQPELHNTNHIITKTKTTTTVSVGPVPSPVTKGARRRKTISFTATAALRQFIGEEAIDPISRRGPPWLFFLGDWAESDRNLPLPAASESEERLGALCERRGPVRVGSDLSSVLVAPQSLAKMEMLMPRHHPSKLSS